MGSRSERIKVRSCAERFSAGAAPTPEGERRRGPNLSSKNPSSFAKDSVPGAGVVSPVRSTNKVLTVCSEDTTAALR